MIDKAILDGLEQIDDSKDLSQLVRSNAPQYWRYMADRADLNCLRRYLPFEGIVAGDPHMDNFGILPLRTDTGARQMKYVNIDFDDAGRGPFVLDFIHYVITSKAVGGDVKIRHLQDTYLQGLAGREIEPRKS
jgi:Ser/Thr protein kinase RdoA (MazF antagonist)